MGLAERLSLVGILVAVLAGLATVLTPAKGARSRSLIATGIVICGSIAILFCWEAIGPGHDVDHVGSNERTVDNSGRVKASELPEAFIGRAVTLVESEGIPELHRILLAVESDEWACSDGLVFSIHDPDGHVLSTISSNRGGLFGYWNINDYHHFAISLSGEPPTVYTFIEALPLRLESSGANKNSCMKRKHQYVLN